MTTLETSTPTRAPLSQIPTPTGSGLLVSSLVLARRSLIRTLRTPEALIDVTLQPVIFLALFTYVFGGAISHGSQSAYLAYLVPGILGQTIAMASVPIGSNLHEDISKGVFDRFRSLPIPRLAPLLGTVLADFVRYLILFVVMIGTATVMGYHVVSWPGVFGALLLSILFSLCMCWVSVFVGMTARTSGAVTGVMMLLIFPLSFGSSAFADPSTMPGWLQSFVRVNPLTHLIEAVRGLMVGAPDTSAMVWTGVWMAALVAIFLPLALRAYNRKV